MKRIHYRKVLAIGFLAFLLLCGCGAKQPEVEMNLAEETANEETASEETASEETVNEETVKEETTDEGNGEAYIALEDGIYLATFQTDSSMFHVNETLDDKGILTVENGKASIHIVLTSKNILNLYEGLTDDAIENEADWLSPTEEEVTYSDGLTETVNAFDVPVPYLEQEFDLALIGKKGVWYDHKVSVSEPVPYEQGEAETIVTTDAEESQGTQVEVSLEGGSGKASITSPADVKQDEQGNYVVTLCWSSPYYDYMIVDGEKYLPVNEEGNSVFEIPVVALDAELTVTADTVAMSKPHEIEYQIVLKTINQ